MTTSDDQLIDLKITYENVRHSPPYHTLPDSLADLAIDSPLCYQAQRRFTCSSKRPSWMSLSSQIKERFNLPKEFMLGLSYTDSDGDAVLL